MWQAGEIGGSFGRINNLSGQRNNYLILSESGFSGLLDLPD